MKKAHKKGIIIICLVSILILSLLYIKYDNVKHSLSVSKNIEINTFCILTDVKNHNIYLKEFKGKLIFYFSQYNCMSCVYNQIQAIRHSEKHFGTSDMIIITDYSTIKDLQIFKNANNPKFKIFRTTDRLFKKKKIELNIPIFFSFNEKLNTENVFICHDISGKLTIDFLEQFYTNNQELTK